LLMVQRPTHRFAIATFDEGEQVDMAVRALARVGINPNSTELLATHHAFLVNATALADAIVHQPCELLFPDNAELIKCTPGPVARFLTDELNTGYRCLADALDLSGFPNLAKALERNVEQHRLLLWVPVHDDVEERKVGLTLLAMKPRSYEVHDFVL
jgi:hypothetical protein